MGEYNTDQTVTVDEQLLQELLRKIAELDDTVQSVEERITGITSGNEKLYRLLSEIQEKQDATQSRVKRLYKDQRTIIDNQQALFNNQQTILDNQERSIKLQRTTNEMTEIRKRIEKEYGKNEQIREAMFGVIRLSDLQLVKLNKITDRAEELMLASESYWLAPCLVAVIAWMDRKMNLANRAIAEAVRRDEEKTALTMALICRRNRRNQTGYEWLSLYFSKLDPTAMSDSAIACVNAYVNGIFGKDEAYACDDFIKKWILDIHAAHADFGMRQVEKWESYCDGFTVDARQKYPALEDTVEEFSELCTAAGRIEAYEAICDDFAQIRDAEVDEETITREIDTMLVNLIGRYDRQESELRLEEQRLKLINEHDGDEERAQSEINAKKSRMQENGQNIMEYLTAVLMDPDNANPSMRKTAVKFLRPYINRGYANYIETAETAFPQSINLRIGNWSCKVGRAVQVKEICREYTDWLKAEKKETLRQWSWAVDMGTCLIFAVGVVCALAAMTAGLEYIAAALPGLVILAVCLYFGNKLVKNRISEKLRAEYKNILDTDRPRLKAALQQWNALCGSVFDFEQTDRRTIV